MKSSLKIFTVISVCGASLFLHGFGAKTKPDIYRNPELPMDQLAAIRVGDKNVSITHVDGIITTSYEDFLDKKIYAVSLMLERGIHELTILYKDEKIVSISKYDLGVKPGDSYTVRSEVVGDAAALFIIDDNTEKKAGTLILGTNEPVFDPTERIDHFPLYSFLPLQEEGWQIIFRDPYKLNMFKKGENTDETYAVTIFQTDITDINTNEALVDFLKEEINKEINTKRYKFLKEKFIPFEDKDYFCFCYEVNAEDHDAAKRSKKIGHMILRIISLDCRHPENNNLAVNIGYSHRYYSGDEDPDMEDKAMALFNSFEFK